MDDRYNYNYEDSYLSSEEKKNRIYNETIERNNVQQRKLFKIVFPVLGIIYIIIGALAYFISNEIIVGIVFVCIGLFFVLLGFILAKCIRTKHYTNEEIEEKMVKTGTNNYALKTIVQEARINLLETEVKELKERIRELERKLK